MYPLTFEPYLRPQVWGNRRLATELRRALPPEGRFGESWEISSHPLHVSRVADGDFAGRPINELWDNHREDLAGPGFEAVPQFPLLVKYLDCDDNLSVQVHPDDAQARAAGHACGKSEAWYVLEADPTARIYAGFKPGVTRAEVERRLDDGSLVECLNVFTPQRGDSFYIPAGTVHALGGGLLVAEIQQPSDVTYRLYDWDRVGSDGRRRELHREQALAAINWNAPTVQPVRCSGSRHFETMVQCPYFRLDRWELQHAEAAPVAGPAVVLVVEGELFVGSLPGMNRYGDFLAQRDKSLTRERLVLLDVVASKSIPFTADDLVEVSSRRISRSTAYRRLMELAEAGLIRETGRDDGDATLYERGPLAYLKRHQRGDVLFLPASCEPLVWFPPRAGRATVLLGGFSL